MAIRRENQTIVISSELLLNGMQVGFKEIP